MALFLCGSRFSHRRCPSTLTIRCGSSRTHMRSLSCAALGFPAAGAYLRLYPVRLAIFLPPVLTCTLYPVRYSILGVARKSLTFSVLSEVQCAGMATLKKREVHGIQLLRCHGCQRLLAPSLDFQFPVTTGAAFWSRLYVFGPSISKNTAFRSRLPVFGPVMSKNTPFWSWHAGRWARLPGISLLHPAHKRWERESYGIFARTLDRFVKSGFLLGRSVGGHNHLDPYRHSRRVSVPRKPPVGQTWTFRVNIRPFCVFVVAYFS